jgi:hypothetical protein
MKKMLEIKSEWLDEENCKNVFVNLINDNGIFLVVSKTYVNENSFSYSLDFYDNVKKYFTV